LKEPEYRFGLDSNTAQVNLTHRGGDSGSAHPIPRMTAGPRCGDMEKQNLLHRNKILPVLGLRQGKTPHIL
jgi:hypothetical protein